MAAAVKPAECRDCGRFTADGAVDGYTDKWICCTCLSFPNGMPKNKLMLADRCTAGYLASLLSQIGNGRQGYYAADGELQNLPYLVPKPRKHMKSSKQAFFEDLAEIPGITINRENDSESESESEEEGPKGGPREFGPMGKPSGYDSNFKGHEKGDKGSMYGKGEKGGYFPERKGPGGDYIKGMNLKGGDNHKGMNPMSMKGDSKGQKGGEKGPKGYIYGPQSSHYDRIREREHHHRERSRSRSRDREQGPQMQGPMGPPNAMGRSPGKGGSEKCHNCGETGHYARECPLKDVMICHKCSRCYGLSLSLDLKTENHR